jgi:hypothetical protein
MGRRIERGRVELQAPRFADQAFAADVDLPARREREIAEVELLPGLEAQQRGRIRSRRRVDLEP